jgi:hypothetical protein
MDFGPLPGGCQNLGGKAKASDETTDVDWFSINQLPSLSDGHLPRIEFGFKWLNSRSIQPYFE